MPEWPGLRTPDLRAGGVLSTAGLLVGYNAATQPGSTAWPAANRAIFVPIRLGYPATVYKLVIGGGTTAAGNFDVGIYDASGNKLVSSGATAKSASVEHILDITDTVIGPGLYYLALAADGTNNYVAWVPPAPAIQNARLLGILQAATSYTLPATVTFAACTSGYLPAIAAYLRPY